eukprot:2791274-Lingulodinium_polyedra.AAC.1
MPRQSAKTEPVIHGYKFSFRGGVAYATLTFGIRNDGKDEFSPRRTRCTPDVLRWEPKSPAKPASTK